MSAHKHAALALQFAQDMAETDRPNSRWQYREDGGAWEDCDDEAAPAWYDTFEYRRKPRTININGLEVPEPMREEPENRTIYWMPDMMTTIGAQITSVQWKNDHADNVWLSRGLCHLTREAAELHARALISFTQQ